MKLLQAKHLFRDTFAGGSKRGERYYNRSGELSGRHGRGYILPGLVDVHTAAASERILRNPPLKGDMRSAGAVCARRRDLGNGYQHRKKEELLAAAGQDSGRRTGKQPLGAVRPGYWE